MLFNSVDFMIFFPIVTTVFFIMPKRLRHVWLLVASYFFYMSWNPKYAILIALSTIITYLSGILIGVFQSRRKKKLILVVALGSNLAILGVFKYLNFVLQILNSIVQNMGWRVIDRRIDLLLPVGISFYTFQALSYIIDVYREKIKAEKNIFRYALFVSFFPQLVAGPIERSENLLGQIQRIQQLKLWDFERVRDGILLMFWGLFQKLVIADRASLLVNQVYNNYTSYGFLELAIASVLFAFQIYCDFGGYTNIARGAAQVMGFKLIQNFRQPYFAIGIRDFWKRWHISLTSWFTDYLYIPLGGNRKGITRQYINVFVVFAVSGLWHGAGWHFVAWGVLHAFYQISESIVNHFGGGRTRILSFSQKLERRICTFVLIDIAWVFFAAESMHHAYGIFWQSLHVFQTTNIYELGLDRGNWFMLLFGIAVLAIVDSIHEQGKSVFFFVSQQTVLFRWAVYLGLIWSVVLFGIYGIGYDSSQFIYFQF